jgi:hypothetical protein
MKMHLYELQALVTRSSSAATGTDKILESLAAGTNSKDTVTSQYLNTTAQYGSCHQASHTQSQLTRLVYNIAYPTE